MTTAGECLLATLEGFDKNTNVVVSDVVDRYTSKPVAMAQAVRGSEIVAMGPFEGKLESADSLPRLKDTKNKIKDEYLIWEKVWQKN